MHGLPRDIILRVAVLTGAVKDNSPFGSIRVCELHLQVKRLFIEHFALDEDVRLQKEQF